LAVAEVDYCSTLKKSWKLLSWAEPQKKPLTVFCSLQQCCQLVCEIISKSPKEATGFNVIHLKKHLD